MPATAHMTVHEMILITVLLMDTGLPITFAFDCTEELGQDFFLNDVGVFKVLYWKAEYCEFKCYLRESYD